MVGLVVGMVRFIWEQAYSSQPCATKHFDDRPAIISSINYLHFRVILLLFTLMVSVTLSLLTKPIPSKYVNFCFFLLTVGLLICTNFVFVD
jgi:hypothetical protein